jgi:aconitate hydratase
VDTDLLTEPLGKNEAGEEIYLKDIWPSPEDIRKEIAESVQPEMFAKEYSDVFTGNKVWNAIEGNEGDIYNWDEASTYIQEPPFFVDLSSDVPPIKDIQGARVLAVLGDSITTDHISPAGAIPAESPSGKYLIEKNVSMRDFNSFGSRRGNDQVMTRGTFGNIRLKNLLVPGVEGGFTKYMPDGKQMTIYDASQRYMEDGTPLIVIAGKEYGTGSSRDWAAKGTQLLNVKAVIAGSYERIHRSNLIGMGVLPLQFLDGDSRENLGLAGDELYTIKGIDDGLAPKSQVTVSVERNNGERFQFQVLVRIDTDPEVEYYRNGGILHKVLRDMAAD